MSDLPATPPTSVDALSRPRQWITSSLLMLLTLAVAAACVIVLSVTLTQTRVTASAGDGGNLGIRKLDYVGRKWATLMARIGDADTRLATESAKTADLASAATSVTAEHENNVKTIEQLLASFNHRVAPIDPETYELINRKGYDVQVSVLAARRADLIARTAEFGRAIDDIVKAYERYLDSRKRAVSVPAALKANRDIIAANEKFLENAREDLDRQFELVKPGLADDRDARARIENAFYELNINNFDCGRGNSHCGPVGGLLNRGLYHLMTLRPDLLTLLLVILMGVLGSALQISHAYFMKNQVQTVGGYFQRISVGAMTALVIFIVAKAGVPVLADPTRLGGDAPINPYFVSFLAIVSGLLSENAIANVQAQGAKLFGAGSSGPKRWARADLSGGLTDQGLSLPYLSQQLGLEEADTTAMLKGSKPLEPEQQKLVAIYLRASIRDLFTDIPPAA